MPYSRDSWHFLWHAGVCIFGNMLHLLIYIVWLDTVTYLHHHGVQEDAEKMPWYRSVLLLLLLSLLLVLCNSWCVRTVTYLHHHGVQEDAQKMLWFMSVMCYFVVIL
jgi:hypothetical protein